MTVEERPLNCRLRFLDTYLFEAFVFEKLQFYTYVSFSAEPHVRDIFSEGDHHPFAFVAGVPSINLRFVNGQQNRTVGNFPTKHSQFDTYTLARMLDPGKEKDTAL